MIFIVCFHFMTVFIFIEKKITIITQNKKTQKLKWYPYQYVIGTLLNAEELCLTKIHINLFIITKNVLFGKKGDCKEIYKGNSIFHSKDVERADETFKMFIKGDWRRIILRVNSILWNKKTIIFLVCIVFILKFNIRDGYTNDSKSMIYC